MIGQNPHVLVIGGGIGGSGAALALHRAGLRVTVCEQHPRAAGDLGAFLTLASNGMRALAQIGAAETVGRVGFDLTELSMMDASGTVLMTRPMGDAANPLTRFRCLRWRDLTAALQAEVRRRGIELRHGAGLSGLHEDADGVTARFTDGSSLTADLVIGADGLNSTVRPLIDPDAAAPRYAGQRVFYGYTSAVSPPAAPGRITMVRGQEASFGYAVSPGGETFWFARQAGEALPAGQNGTAPSASLLEGLLTALRLDRTPTAGIVEATGEILATNATDLADVAVWFTPRLLLMGDAAHAASPATGQGASMALEDAVVLAKALRDSDSLEEALALYEGLRRPRTQHNIAASAAMTGNTASPRPAGPPPPTRPSAEDEAELARQLDWETPLTPS